MSKMFREETNRTQKNAIKSGILYPLCPFYRHKDLKTRTARSLGLLDAPIVFQLVKPSRLRRGFRELVSQIQAPASPFITEVPKPKGPSPTADEAVCSRGGQL